MFAKRAGRNNPHREEYIEKAKYYFTRSYDLSPTMVSGLIALIYVNSEMGTSTPETLLKKISSSLQIFPLEASSVNAIGMLTDCELQDICNITPNEYISIVANALSNENSSKGYRATILHIASEYLAIKANDYPTAIHYSRLAIEENPKFYTAYARLANWLIDTGKLEEAKEVLERYRDQDTFGVHRKELDEAISSIDEALHH
jgi:tetratricopeptide (TPR) repeat protein